MHEVGLMQNALDLAIEAAARQRAGRIHRLTLRVGALAGVEPAALEFAFEVVVAGTVAEGARLVVESAVVTCFCQPCGREFEPACAVFECPRCGEVSRDVRRGYELELASLEVS